MLVTSAHVRALPVHLQLGLQRSAVLIAGPGQNYVKGDCQLGYC